MYGYTYTQDSQMLLNLCLKFPPVCRNPSSLTAWGELPLVSVDHLLLCSAGGWVLSGLVNLCETLWRAGSLNLLTSLCLWSMRGGAQLLGQLHLRSLSEEPQSIKAPWMGDTGSQRLCAFVSLKFPSRPAGKATTPGRLLFRLGKQGASQRPGKAPRFWVKDKLRRYFKS